MTTSLLSLLQSELGVTASKGDRLTDWLRRPLSAEQCDYAASDVAHLFQLQDFSATVLVCDGKGFGERAQVLAARATFRHQPLPCGTRARAGRPQGPCADGARRAALAGPTARRTRPCKLKP